MSGPVERGRTYWPTVVIHVEGNTAAISTYKDDGSGSHIRKSLVTRFDEVVDDLVDWLEAEMRHP